MLINLFSILLEDAEEEEDDDLLEGKEQDDDDDEVPLLPEGKELQEMNASMGLFSKPCVDDEDM